MSSAASSVGAMVETLGNAQARRIALAAQGFGRTPSGPVGIRQLRATLDRLAVLQLDSVNVFERSHYLPFFARLGAYDKADLDRLLYGRRGNYIEYWAHQAAIIPLEHRPLWHWSMAEWHTKKEVGRWGAEHPEMLDFVRDELASATRPLTAGEIEHDANQRRGPWWGWSDVKMALEVLFMWGEVVTGRTRFERTYELAARRVPAPLLAREVPRADAIRELTRHAVRALGIGTLRDIADYYRLLQAPVEAALDALTDAGEVVRVSVRGWDRPAWMHSGARIPRRIEATALLSPFDPIVWERERALRMFKVPAPTEIYTPAPQRVFGYYTLPLLIDDSLVGRIDLKSDRQNGVLRVQSAWHEGDQPVDLDRVSGLLARTAAWQGLGEVVFADRGDLIAGLAAHHRRQMP